MSVLVTVENTAEAWSIRASEHVESWWACGWTFDGQLDRFDAVLDEMDAQPGERLLDWGCGTGALSAHLDARVDYVGFDWAAGMVARARAEHPGRRFQVWEPLGMFDLVACVGPFNLSGGWSKEATWHTLRRLFERTSRMLVASLYAGGDEACLSYSVRECERFARGESYRGRAVRWRHNDVLVVVER